MKTDSIAVFAYMILFATTVQAVDIHVDSRAAAGGDGTVGAPYDTFAQGLAAAGNGDSLLVRGGEGQRYSDYPYTVWQTNLTVAAYGADRPLFAVTSTVVAADSGVFIVSAPGFRMSGLGFYATPSACSHENGAMVRLDTGADNALIEGNTFEWDTVNVVKMGYVVRGTGTNLVVRNNIFSNLRYQYSNGAAVTLGDHALVAGNTFTNMHTAVFVGSYGTVVSNTVVNANGSNGALIRAGYNRGRSALVAFNTVLQNDGTANPAIVKPREGFTAADASTPTRIHNNTVVGTPHFIRCENSNYIGSSWAPVIVNNIAYCASTNLLDVSESIHQNNNGGVTIFSPGTIIQNNLFANGLGVVFEDRVTVLCAENVHDNGSRVVAFMNDSDPFSENYLVPSWEDRDAILAAYGTPENGYPLHIGAKRPFVPQSTLLTIR